ncbi:MULTISPECIES: hypothetical protein [Pseudomonas]|uniref:hypothetical protein n=1 Tax=Pseudomonas TaxID=286 RepID=UPI0015574A5F|nr:MULTISPECIES: hypothetical protein [Pseudomonas]MCG8907919.1 hypothetical protein [Pseudomonas sp. DP-17]MDU4252292.1 hypothetical protein [Pseudomonas sp.]
MRIAVTLVLPILLMLSLFGFDFLYTRNGYLPAAELRAPAAPMGCFTPCRSAP